jgi:hypothetical protein
MIHQPFLEQCSHGQFKEHGTGYQEYRGSGFPEQGTEKEGRPAISAKAQTILDFLRGCTPYEADSIRVMVGYGTGNGDTATIEATDMLAVNRFLNHGLTKENGTDGEAVMKHRQERAQKLMEAVKDFVDIGQLCRVSVALMKISSDFKAVEDARGHLQSQPAANVNRN